MKTIFFGIDTWKPGKLTINTTDDNCVFKNYQELFSYTVGGKLT